MIEITVVMPSLLERVEMRENALGTIARQALPPAAIVMVLGRTPWDGRNAALRAVQTPWVAFCDDDDLWMPEHLELLAAEAERSGADVIYSRAAVRVGAGVGDEWTVDADSPARLEERNEIPISYLVRTSLCRLAGGFPPRTDRPSDWLFLLRLKAAGARFSFVPKVTWAMRRHEGNTYQWRDVGASS